MTFHVICISEIGSSHDGSLDNALALIDASADAGADYAKFQLFTGDDLWHKSDSRLEETKRLALPESWIPKLIEKCWERKIGFLCTPFSPHAVDVLEANKVRNYKIASGDITYTPLLEKIAKTGKNVFLSVGASDFKEIDTAVSILKDNNLVIMHCDPSYPAKPENANVRRILDLSERYTMKKNIPVGLSSHLREWWVDVASVFYRTYCIEKHIALVNDDGSRIGPEATHSLSPDEFSMFVAAVRDMEQAMDAKSTFTEGEIYARINYRRSPSDWLRPSVRP